MAWMTTALSIDFSRATASAICKSSSLLALTPVTMSLAPHKKIVMAGPVPATHPRRVRAAS
jgi:hypothetical protein